MGIFRICAAESTRFPDIGRTFFETGPRVMSEQMISVIKRGEAAGDLSVDQPRIAAVQFFLLCRGPFFYPVLFQVMEGVGQSQRMRGMAEGLRTFSARYGTPAFTARMETALEALVQS